MIGIDITDLSDPLLKDRGKAHRLITHPLDERIKENDFWVLWTSKEAVFKASRKLTRFLPKLIPIQFTNEHQFVSNDLRGQVIETENYVLSLASYSKWNHHIVFKRETSDPSAEIRQKISHWFQTKYQMDTQVIENDDNLPILSHDLSPISISHHGRYLAFAY